MIDADDHHKRKRAREQFCKHCGSTDHFRGNATKCTHANCNVNASCRMRFVGSMQDPSPGPNPAMATQSGALDPNVVGDAGNVAALAAAAAAAAARGRVFQRGRPMPRGGRSPFGMVPGRGVPRGRGGRGDYPRGDDDGNDSDDSGSIPDLEPQNALERAVQILRDGLVNDFGVDAWFLEPPYAVRADPSSLTRQSILQYQHLLLPAATVAIAHPLFLSFKKRALKALMASAAPSLPADAPIGRTLPTSAAAMLAAGGPQAVTTTAMVPPPATPFPGVPGAVAAAATVKAEGEETSGADIAARQFTRACEEAADGRAALEQRDYHSALGYFLGIVYFGAVDCDWLGEAEASERDVGKLVTDLSALGRALLALPDETVGFRNSRCVAAGLGRPDGYRGPITETVRMFQKRANVVLDTWGLTFVLEVVPRSTEPPSSDDDDDDEDDDDADRVGEPEDDDDDVIPPLVSGAGAAAPAVDGEAGHSAGAQ
eukprot:TRINITY_DN768_c0_g1_i2.p1 TRINITY_DN768_c0_g1~~TRINITY_DN768_c0_g1_i2.p1  ORF type:complete len:486 (+),score=64.35 TRINITY_DN768_c0_g1_i2:179-1636(+)